MPTPEELLESTEDIGELDVSEYLVLLLAWDTYFRYLKETLGTNEPSDVILQQGVTMLRMAELSAGDGFQSFLDSNLPTPIHKKMLAKAWRFALTRDGLPRKALQLRTLLSRGGAATMRNVFKTNKALQQVRAAMAASMIEDADAALDKFAVIQTKNTRIRNWIDKAADYAGSGTFQNPVSAGAKPGADDTAALLQTRVQQAAASPTSQTSAEADGHQEDLLIKVQTDAQEAAQKALQVIGEKDEPPAKSEVIGIATAAVAAAMSNPEDDRNVPAPLRMLDPEQRAAALTDGRVLVAAGAGAGKSTTLVSRIEFLVKDRKVNPARILACSFNKKAADQLKEKIAKQLGYSAGSTSGVNVGTMHALFYKFITGDRQLPGFGSAEEQAMLKPPRLIAPPKRGVKSVSPVSVTAAIRGMWNDCSPEVLASMTGAPAEWFDGGPPKAKKTNLILNVWRGNSIGLEEAKKLIRSKAEAQAYVWYEFYMGLKGDLPGWRPPCGQGKSLTNFMAKNRPGGERLGDLDDMLQILRAILKRDPKARQTLQGMFDHFLVDECQDLNQTQHDIFEMLSEQVGDGKDGKSIWMIGDDKQAIYQFRGSRPELFKSLDGKEGWTTRMIRTNYRCEPEIVEAANQLVAQNTNRIPMDAVANPKKPRGKASIIMNMPEDNVEAAINTIGRVRKDMDTDGAQPEEYAVLARTNAELNDFETSCIIYEIPYIRQGGKGFLEAPESRAVLGYVDLLNGNDYEKMKGSLAAVLTKPDRGLFLGPEDVMKAINEALDDVARRERVDVKSVRPSMLLQPSYIGILADRLKQPYRLKIVNSVKGQYGRPDTSKGEWMYKKRVEELTTNLRGLANDLADLQDKIDANTPTTDLLNFILDGMTSKVAGWDSVRRQPTLTTTTLREQITNDQAMFADDDGDDAEEEEIKGEVGEDGQLIAPEKKQQEAKGLGAVQFLFALAEPNVNDQNANTDPSTAQGFVAKLSRYSKLAESLRIDPDKWAREQANLADPGQRRVTPPAITLATVHSVKGAEWKNVTVLMPKGIFPIERKPKPDEPPPDPAEESARLEAERNLAYVALTRAAVNLEVLCPSDKGTSQFVLEAGLVPGENVPKPGANEPMAKEATLLEDPYVIETLDLYSSEASAALDYSYLRGQE